MGRQRVEFGGLGKAVAEVVDAPRVRCDGLPEDMPHRRIAYLLIALPALQVTAPLSAVVFDVISVGEIKKCYGIVSRFSADADPAQPVPVSMAATRLTCWSRSKP